MFSYLIWILFLIYLTFLGFLFVGLFRLKQRRFSNNLNVSVIIPFRNESHNLVRCIESVLTQNFPSDKFEIILVDDHSDDDYEEKLRDYLIHKRITLLKLRSDADGYGKKNAIEKGIQMAKNEIIVTSDADCYHQKDWLKTLIESFDDDTGFVAGKVIYDGCKNFFEELQKIEFASLVSIGASFIGNEIPLIANGASCGYRKDLFLRVGGFKDNLNLVSGDEEFLMQKIWLQTNYKITFNKSKNSTTITQPISEFSKFINQRKRWVSKVLHYKNFYAIPLLILLYIFHVTLLTNIIIGLFDQKVFTSILIVLLIKGLVDFIYMINAYSLLSLSETKKNMIYLILLFPLAEIAHIFYISIVPILSALSGFDWKGRKYKK